MSASTPPSVIATVEPDDVADPYVRPAASPRTSYSEPLVAPLSATTAATAVGHAYTCAAVATVYTVGVSVLVNTGDVPTRSVSVAVYVVLAFALSVYATVEPDTVGAPSTAPVDASEAVSPESVALTVAGTGAESVVTIGDAVPRAGWPVVDAMPGQTSMLDAGIVATSRARVGPTVNVILVSVASPVYVADNTPPTTAVPIALKDPPDVAMPSVVGATEKVTGTPTSDPETSTSPLTISPSATVPAETVAIGFVVSVEVCPSGALTTAENRTEPDAGATDPSVYRPIDTVFAVASNVKLANVPYAVPVATESTALTELTAMPAMPAIASTIELVFPSPHTTVPPICALVP